MRDASSVRRRLDEVAYARSLRPRRAIVAESDSRLRRFLVAWLLDFGWEVREAESAAELRAQLVEAVIDQEVPDLIVTELHTSDGGALEVLADLSETPLSILVVAIMQDRSLETMRLARRHGVSSVISKPFDLRTFGELLRSIAQHVD